TPPAAGSEPAPPTMLGCLPPQRSTSYQLVPPRHSCTQTPPTLEAHHQTAELADSPRPTTPPHTARSTSIAPDHSETDTSALSSSPPHRGSHLAATARPSPPNQGSPSQT